MDYVAREHQHFIDNRAQPPAGKAAVEVIDPSTGRRLGSIARGNAKDIDRAVIAARTAYDRTWYRTPAVTRGRLLQRWSELVARHAEELAMLECLDTGKPLRQARADASALARYFEFYAGAADKLHGHTIPYEEAMALSRLISRLGKASLSGTQHVSRRRRETLPMGSLVLSRLLHARPAVRARGRDIAPRRCRSPRTKRRRRTARAASRARRSPRRRRRPTGPTRTSPPSPCSP